MNGDRQGPSARDLLPHQKICHTTSQAEVNAQVASFQMQPLGDRGGQLASGSRPAGSQPYEWESSCEWDLGKEKELSY